jgi:hypothetical protein
VWADTTYRSTANETFLNKNGFASHIHRKKPKGRAMHKTMRRANNAKSRACDEHVFAEQKHRMGLVLRDCETRRRERADGAVVERDTGPITKKDSVARTWPAKQIAADRRVFNGPPSGGRYSSGPAAIAIAMGSSGVTGSGATAAGSLAHRR